MCSLYSRILQKNIFMNQFTKTHVPGFQIEQRAGNEWENRESWPRRFLALLLQSRILAPKWTFRKSSQRERASQSLFILLEGKKNIQRKAWWKGLPVQDASKPLALSRTSGQCLWGKQDAHFPSSSIFSHPPPPTYINWQWQADRKRAVPSIWQNTKTEKAAYRFSLFRQKLQSAFTLASATKRFKNVNRSWIEMYIWVFIVEFFRVVFIFEIFLRKNIFRYFCILWYSFGNTHEIVKGGKEYSLWYIYIKKKSQALMFVINF